MRTDASQTAGLGQRYPLDLESHHGTGTGHDLDDEGDIATLHDRAAEKRAPLIARMHVAIADAVAPGDDGILYVETGLPAERCKNNFDSGTTSKMSFIGQHHVPISGDGFSAGEKFNPLCLTEIVADIL